MRTRIRSKPLAYDVVRLKEVDRSELITVASWLSKPSRIPAQAEEV